MSATPLSAHQIREVAVKVPCDPRPVAKVLRREPVEEMLRERIIRTLREMGHGDLVAEHGGPSAA